jgi:SAM-dependent methyltransferase
MALLYGEDLAYIHHHGFTQSLREATPHLLALLKQHGLASGTVVDLGCGTGVWARGLTDAGYDVLGVDDSKAMLAIARKEAPRARFKQASLFEASIPPCVAVTSFGECLNYDPGRGKALERQKAIEKLARQVFKQLQPGGLFVFDVHLRTKAPEVRRRQSEHFGEGWAIYHESEINPLGIRLLRSIVFFRKVGGKYRDGNTQHFLHLFDAARLTAILERAGFRVETMQSYGDVPLLPARMGFVASKPK